MAAKIIALIASMVLGIKTPASLDDPSRYLTAIVPEGRVLFAATERENEGPILVKETLGPDISADSYIVLDIVTGKILTAKNPSLVHSVASLTKLLTALTVRRHASPNEIVTVGEKAVKVQPRGADMKLQVGEQLKVQDLLAGLLVSSANDAAVALAEHISGTEDDFAREMNQVAKNLGLMRTQVVNATGFDDKSHFSTVYDMALLLSHAWRDPLLGIYLRAESLDVFSIDRRVRHHLRTTNRLLGKRADILAGKTGFTGAAGESLAVIAENDEGHPIAAVLLGSRDRFGDMENLLNWSFWAYEWPEEDKK